MAFPWRVGTIFAGARAGAVAAAPHQSSFGGDLRSSSVQERRRRGSDVRVFATAENGQRGPSLGAGVAGAGVAGAGRDALPPGLAGRAGRCDGAAPVVVGALDLPLACSVRLYPIPNPRRTRMTTSAASQGHIDLPLLGDSGSRRRGRSERGGLVP
jgi:hypothetical protein